MILHCTDCGDRMMKHNGHFCCPPCDDLAKEQQEPTVQEVADAIAKPMSPSLLDQCSVIDLARSVDRGSFVRSYDPHCGSEVINFSIDGRKFLVTVVAVDE